MLHLSETCFTPEWNMFYTWVKHVNTWVKHVLYLSETCFIPEWNMLIPEWNILIPEWNLLIPEWNLLIPEWNIWYLSETCWYLSETYRYLSETCWYLSETCWYLSETYWYLKRNMLIPEWNMLIPEWSMLIPKWNMFIPEWNMWIPEWNMLIPEWNMFPVSDMVAKSFHFSQADSKLVQPHTHILSTDKVAFLYFIFRLKGRVTQGFRVQTKDIITFYFILSTYNRYFYFSWQCYRNHCAPYLAIVKGEEHSIGNIHSVTGIIVLLTLP